MTYEVKYREIRRSLDVWGDSAVFAGEVSYAGSDGWEAVFVVESLGGRLVVSAITVRPTGDHVPDGGLTTRRLRRIGMARAVRDVRRYAQQAIGGYAGVPVSAPATDARTGPRRDRADVLARIGELYDEAMILGVPAHAKWIWERLAAEGECCAPLELTTVASSRVAMSYSVVTSVMAARAAVSSTIDLLSA